MKKIMIVLLIIGIGVINSNARYRTILSCDWLTAQHLQKIIT
jgi:hypothetical protein